MRGRKKQPVSTSSAAALAKERESGKEKEMEKEASKEPKEKEATETGRERLRRKGKKEMGGEGDEAAKEKQQRLQGKGKEKELPVVVVREDGEQENGKEKEKAAGEDVCPQFFKVFFPGQSTERLKIPPKFQQHLKDQTTGPVSLKGPSGNKWQAALALESEEWRFEQGWKEFVTDHSLKPGHFLVFTYDGPSQFSVVVFSSAGIIDPAAMDAKPKNETVVKVEEHDEGVQGDMDANASEDLVDMMDDKISESFNADFEDNSVEEVAEQLLIIHEECLQNNYSSLEKLRNSHVQGNAVSQSRQIVADDEDDSDSSDDGDDTSMMEEEEAAPDDMAVDRPRPPRPTPDADGWTVVPPRRGGRSRN